MSLFGATPKTTLPSSSSSRASTLASKLVSIVPGCHKSHSRSQAMITIVKQVSHMREADYSALAKLTGEPRGKHGKMATCHEKSRLLLSFFPFFQEPHTRKSQWVVTVTKYRFYSSALPALSSVYMYILVLLLHIACLCLPNRTLFS